MLGLRDLQFNGGTLVAFLAVYKLFEVHTLTRKKDKSFATCHALPGEAE